MSGNEVKQVIKDSGLKCWEVAYAWGMTDGNFSRNSENPFPMMMLKSFMR